MPMESLSSMTRPTYVPVANPKANAKKFRTFERSVIITSKASSQITISKNAMTGAMYLIPLEIEMTRIVSRLSSPIRAKR
jgi:hypothetical protein